MKIRTSLKIVRNAWWIFFVTLLIAAFLLRYNISLPMTYSETVEGYTAYSLIKEGKDIYGGLPSINYFSEGDYFSGSAIYLRIPFVLFNGLNNLSIRLPTILAGILSLISFWLWVSSIPVFKGNSRIKIASVVLYAFSFWVIQINLFKLDLSLSLFFLYLGLYFINLKKIAISSILLIAAVICSYITAPFVTGLVLYLSKQYKLTRSSLILFLPIIAIVLVLIVDSNFTSFIKQKSLLSELDPRNYLWRIDRRLAYSYEESAPFSELGFFIDRITHNKIGYGFNNLFSSIITSVNFEGLTSSFQSSQILKKDPHNFYGLPYLAILEIPLIFWGIVLAFKKNYRHLLTLFFLSLSNSIFFPFTPNSFFFSLPFLLIFEGMAILRIFEWLKDENIKKYFGFLNLKVPSRFQNMNIFSTWFFPLPAWGGVAILVAIFIQSQLVFQDLFRYHQNQWMMRSDLVHNLIWEYIKSPGDYSLITVTDRLENPAYYYYYYKVPPPSEIVGSLKIDKNNSRITKSSNVEFYSFKYYEDDRKKDQIWIGYPAEFKGKNNDFEKTEVFDGGVADRIRGLSLGDKEWGDELWIVKTKFKDE